ncbi:MAG: hypothetical protein IPP22_08145 [Nitrosomonas sp.]|nr:hypothetical protein [Nitrosomonas sp.]
MKTLFIGHVRNKIGIMGHSRGGEAVVSAARMNYEQALGHSIKPLFRSHPPTIITVKHSVDLGPHPIS